MRFVIILSGLFVVTAFSSKILAQQITKEWESRYSQPGFTDDYPLDVFSDGNGNTIVLGQSGWDGVVSKYDNSGKFQWAFQTGRGVFLENRYNANRDLVVDSEGNSYLAIVGQHDQMEHFSQLAIIKIDNNGKQIWKKYIQALGGNVKLALNTDNSVVACYINDPWEVTLSRFTPNGDIMWTKEVSGSGGNIQDVEIFNNNIVVWHHSNQPPQPKASYLHVLSLDGSLKWEEEYKFSDRSATLSALCFHQNEFIAAYYIDQGNTALTEIVRYNATSGDLVKKFTVQMDHVFQDDYEIDVMLVGDDSQIFLIESNDQQVRKYTLDGSLLWSQDLGVEYEYEVLDAIVNEGSSSIDVLLRTEKFNVGDTYSVVSFLSDKTSKVLASLSAVRPDIQPVTIAKSGSNVYIAGTFNNGETYKRDITISKFTTSNVHQWTSTFDPLNSETNSPTCITGDKAGNVYVAGKLWSEPYASNFGVIKYDVMGKQVWVKKIAPDDVDPNNPNSHNTTIALAVAVNEDQEVFITGSVENIDYWSGASRLHTIKLAANGDVLWIKKTSGEIEDACMGFQIGLDNNNNVYVLGFNYNRSKAERNQMVLVKYDGNGNIQWEKRFAEYPRGYLSTTDTNDDSETPKMKIVNNQVFVLISNYVNENNTYPAAFELSKFDAEGNETTLHQVVNRDVVNNFVEPLDFHIDPSGKIYIVYNNFSQTSVGGLGHELILDVLTSTGEKLLSKAWFLGIDSKYLVTDASLISNSDGQLFLATVSIDEFTYRRVGIDGNEIWKKSEQVNGHDNHFGWPTFVHLNAGGNPVFVSTNMNDNRSNFFFITERDQANGEVIDTQIFDENYDHYGDQIYTRPRDLLMSSYQSDDLHDLFLTGVISDKVRGSETFVTLKYKLGDDDDNNENPVTGIELLKNYQIVPYPTITNGPFRIKGLTDATATINIFDSMGSLVCSLNPKDELFDLSSRSSGLYLLKVLHNGSWHVARIIKR